MLGSNLKHRSRGRYGHRPCTLTSSSKPPPPRAAIDGHLLHRRHCRRRPISRSTHAFRWARLRFSTFFFIFSSFLYHTTPNPRVVLLLLTCCTPSGNTRSVQRVGSRRVSAITSRIYVLTGVGTDRLRESKRFSMRARNFYRRETSSQQTTFHVCGFFPRPHIAASGVEPDGRGRIGYVRTSCRCNDVVLASCMIINYAIDIKFVSDDSRRRMIGEGAKCVISRIFEYLVYGKIIVHF